MRLEARIDPGVAELRVNPNAGVAPAPAIPAGLKRAQLLVLYYYLKLTRSLEERLVHLYRQGKVVGGLYRSLGQEGESVASAYALQEGDVLSPLIRNLGSMLVRGARPDEILCQYMAKLDAAVASCEKDPLPKGETALPQVYADPPSAESLWFRQIHG